MYQRVCHRIRDHQPQVYYPPCLSGQNTGTGIFIHRYLRFLTFLEYCRGEEAKTVETRALTFKRNPKTSLFVFCVDNMLILIVTRDSSNFNSALCSGHGAVGEETAVSGWSSTRLGVGSGCSLSFSAPRGTIGPFRTAVVPVFASNYLEFEWFVPTTEAAVLLIQG